MRELPYEFDLMYDIKMMYEVEAVAKGYATGSDATPEELVSLFEKHNIPIPACLVTFSKDIKTNLIVVVIKDGLVDNIIGCRNSKTQEKIFKRQVIERSGFEPEDCDYEDGYYEFMNGSICMTSYTTQ